MKPLIIAAICIVTPLILLSGGALPGDDATAANTPATKIKITETSLAKSLSE